MRRAMFPVSSGTPFTNTLCRSSEVAVHMDLMRDKVTP